jgi:hypothetical protein
MTPFELSLGPELDIERQRFGNEWMFKWYCLNMEGRTVDVPSFDGGRITIGGVLFQGQAQSIYWQSIGRYLNGKVHETFQKWDKDTRSYPVIREGGFRIRRSYRRSQHPVIISMCKNPRERCRARDSEHVLVAKQSTRVQLNCRTVTAPLRIVGAREPPHFLPPQCARIYSEFHTVSVEK